jgi:predicted regulator of amino acid metabolism with ACT domain
MTEHKTTDLQTACNLAALMGFQLLPVIPWMKNEDGVSVAVLHEEIANAGLVVSQYIDPEALSDVDREHYEITQAFIAKLVDELCQLPIYKEGVKTNEPIQQSQADDTSRSDAEDTTEDNSGEHAQS